MKTSLEVLTWLTLLGQALYVELAWFTLPAMLPSHLGKSGVPDAYAPKFILWILIAVSALVIIAIGIIQQFPEMFALPKPPRHPDRARVEEVARSMFAWIRLEVTAIFAVLLWMIVNIDGTQDTAVGAEFTVASTALVLFTIVAAILRMHSTPAETKITPAAPRALPSRQSVRSTGVVAAARVLPRPSGT